LIGCTAARRDLASEEAVAAQTATKQPAKKLLRSRRISKSVFHLQRAAEEKWQRDRAIMEAKAAELALSRGSVCKGAMRSCRIHSAKNLITQGVDA
jgi:hypothetical protein